MALTNANDATPRARGLACGPEVNRRWWWFAGALSFLSFALGCTPSSLSMLLYPFFPEEKVPARCKLTKEKGESTVVVYATFARGAVPLDLEPAANELADNVATQMRQRFAANKDKVIVIAPSKVRSYLNNHLGEAVADKEIGAHFKADYVVNLEIQTLSLYVPGSAKTLFRGDTSVAVAVTDVKAPADEARIFNEAYGAQYPSSGPKDAQGASPLQFRTMFVNKMGKDLSRWFASYPKETGKEMDF
jgi:hypothetical protein